MPINTKHLVITIISVFVALGLGILIGFQLDSQDLILQQQESLIQALEEKFEELSETNQILEEEIKDLQNFQDKIQLYLENLSHQQIKENIYGLNIAVVETSSDYRYPTLVKFLKKAGVNVNSSLFITDKIMDMPQEEQNLLAQELGNTDYADPSFFLVEEITEALAGESAGDIYRLNELGLIKMRGGFTGPPDFVILAGGSKNKDEKVFKVDISLIKKLREKSIPLIGVEASQIEHSYMEYYQKQGISTVDNVDTIIGQISLALIMTGQEGNYGIKEGADALMPLLPEEKSDENIGINSSL